MADYTTTTWSGYTLYECAYGSYATFDLNKMILHLYYNHGIDASIPDYSFDGDEVWIAPRTDNVDGQGAYLDPFDVSTTKKWVAFWESLADKEDITIHLHPGTYLIDDNDLDDPMTEHNDIRVVPQKGWKIYGSGIDRTILKLGDDAWNQDLGYRYTFTTGDVNTTNNTIAKKESLSADDVVRFYGNDLPDPIVEDTPYSVITYDTNNFQIGAITWPGGSTQHSGTPVDITDVGSGTMEVIKEGSFGTFAFFWSNYQGPDYNDYDLMDGIEICDMTMDLNNLYGDNENQPATKQGCGSCTRDLMAVNIRCGNDLKLRRLKVLNTSTCGTDDEKWSLLAWGSGRDRHGIEVTDCVFENVWGVYASAICMGHGTIWSDIANGYWRGSPVYGEAVTAVSTGSDTLTIATPNDTDWDDGQYVFFGGSMVAPLVTGKVYMLDNVQWDTPSAGNVTFQLIDLNNKAVMVNDPPSPALDITGSWTQNFWMKGVLIKDNGEPLYHFQNNTRIENNVIDWYTGRMAHSHPYYSIGQAMGINGWQGRNTIIRNNYIKGSTIGIIHDSGSLDGCVVENNVIDGAWTRNLSFGLVMGVASNGADYHRNIVIRNNQILVDELDHSNPPPGAHLTKGILLQTHLSNVILDGNVFVNNTTAGTDAITFDPSGHTSWDQKLLDVRGNNIFDGLSINDIDITRFDMTGGTSVLGSLNLIAFDDVFQLTAGQVSTTTGVQLPTNSVLLSVQANLETTIVGNNDNGDDLAKIGIGYSGDIDAYGKTTGTTKNQKTNFMNTTWSNAHDGRTIVIYGLTSGDVAATETFATGNRVRVRGVYAYCPASIPDARE